MKSFSFVIICAALASMLLTGCSVATDTPSVAATSMAAAPSPTPVVSSPTPAAVTSAPAVQTISPADAKKLLDGNNGVVLVDVRTADEYAAGHIAGSILLTLDSIADKAAETLPDKDATILVYCRTGIRSAQAARQLTDMGYAHVWSIAGGITAWTYGVVK